MAAPLPETDVPEKPSLRAVVVDDEQLARAELCYLLEQLGGFDAELRRGEDTDLAWRMLGQNKQLVYQASAVIRHRNQATLHSLFHKGVQHGYYSVPLNRKHAKFLQQYGHRPIHRAGYTRLVTSFRAFRQTGSIHAQCEFLFNSGKKLGQLLASARYLYVNI